MNPERLLDIADGLARGSGRLGRPPRRDQLARAVIRFPENIQDFAASFATLQREREVSDYEPDMPYSRYRADELVQAARRAVRHLGNADAGEQRAFALYVLMKLRGR